MPRHSLAGSKAQTTHHCGSVMKLDFVIHCSTAVRRFVVVGHGQQNGDNYYTELLVCPSPISCSNTNASCDLTVAFPISMLFCDLPIIHGWLNVAIAVCCARGNPVHAGRRILPVEMP